MLPEMMTSLALPVRSDFSVDLYPRVTALVRTSFCAMQSSLLTLSALDDESQLGVNAVRISLRFLGGHLDCVIMCRFAKW